MGRLSQLREMAQSVPDEAIRQQILAYIGEVSTQEEKSFTDFKIKIRFLHVWWLDALLLDRGVGIGDGLFIVPRLPIGTGAYFVTSIVPQRNSDGEVSHLLMKWTIDSIVYEIRVVIPSGRIISEPALTETRFDEYLAEFVDLLIRNSRRFTS